VTYILNSDPESHAARFAAKHGPCAASMGWRVVDAANAFAHAVRMGATPYAGDDKALDVPAIVGIGGSLIYFVEDYGPGRHPYSAFDFVTAPKPAGVGFHYLDHLTHNVHKGNMDIWFDFYSRIFGFREIRYFDIKGKATGLFSKAMTAPDNKIRIPLNESQDENSQIEEFLRQYNGEGIQHIAFICDDLIGCWDRLEALGTPMMSPPSGTYYEMLEERLPGHGEPVAELQRRGILLDGSTEAGDPRLLLQIFSETQVGPVFFEFIQRKKDEGFGEGNFTALFKSMERDQLRRGALEVEGVAE
jgi:4-hydroxyphenylpyruvate dioxygenase